MTRRVKIADEGHDRKYFTVIPNIIDDAPLSPYAFRLYAHLKRVAGDEGKCWQSVTTQANACNMSRGMVTKARKELAASSLIRIETSQNPRGGRDFITVFITDIWARNAKLYSKTPSEHENEPASPPEEAPSPPHELASSLHEQASSPGELKNNSIKNMPGEKNQKEGVAAELPYMAPPAALLAQTLEPKPKHSTAAALRNIDRIPKQEKALFRSTVTLMLFANGFKGPEDDWPLWEDLLNLYAKYHFKHEDGQFLECLSYYMSQPDVKLFNKGTVVRIDRAMKKGWNAPGNLSLKDFYGFYANR